MISIRALRVTVLPIYYQALDELKSMGTEYRKALDHQRRLSEVTEVLNATQIDNRKVK